MGLGKAFGFSILAYIGLNFLFTIIVETISGTLNSLFASIGANFLILFIILLGPVIVTPFSAYILIYNGIVVGSTGEIVFSIGYIVSPLISAIIAGKFGENKAGSFGGWFLTAMIMTVVIIIFILTGIFIGSEVDVLVAGIINGIFYASFALLFTSTEYY